MDFTLIRHQEFLNTLQNLGYSFQTFSAFITAPLGKVIILRYDVDRLPDNALKVAMIEHELGITSTYYFRAVPESWNETIMGEIVAIGHELGYHYEDLSIVGGDYTKAIRHFEDQLVRFRRIYPVKTICMHGSPLSKWDNRDLWKQYDYRDFGIIGEPYFDVNFNEVFYITDTGRKWNNSGASVRDQVASGFDIPIKSTNHLMALAERGVLPDHMMITIHPQRWHDKPLPWVKELIWQNLKNIAKWVLIKAKSKR